MNNSRTASNLVALLQYKAQQKPDYPVFNYLSDGENSLQTLTYAAFDEQARQVAAHLQYHQLEGERVLLLFPQGLDYLIALFGCFYAKVIAVPAYPPRNNRTLHRLEAIMRSCNAKAILADDAGIVHITRMKKDFSTYQLLSLEILLEQHKIYQEQPVSPDQIAYLQYTSGSTGDPKGVIVRHQNMLHNISAQEEIFDGDNFIDGAFVTWLPMYHDMGLLSMMTALINEVICYFMSPVHFIQQPARWLRAISKYKAHYSLAPNFAFDFCVDRITDAEIEGIDLSRWKAVTNGSEQVRLGSIQRFSEKFASWGFDLRTFCPAYGMAETTLIVSTIKESQPLAVLHRDEKRTDLKLITHKQNISQAERYLVSAGKPVADMTVVIVDQDTGQKVGEGTEGEIWVSSPGSVTTGYWNNEAATEESFGKKLPGYDGHLFLRTGDLGIVKNSHLFITGRLKDMVIIRGRNYYPQDIELSAEGSHEALEPHSGAAFSMINKEQQEQLVIVQEIKRQYLRGVNTDEVIDAIRTTVSQEFDIVPARIALIKPLSLPKTSSGKIQRFLARRQMKEGKLRLIAEWKLSDEDVKPESISISSDEINKAVIVKWLVKNLAEKAKIAHSEIDVHASVRDYPLESVDAIYLADELSKWLDISVTAEVFWSLPDIDTLAAFLEKKYQEAA